MKAPSVIPSLVLSVIGVLVCLIGQINYDAQLRSATISIDNHTSKVLRFRPLNRSYELHIVWSRLQLPKSENDKYDFYAIRVPDYELADYRKLEKKVEIHVVLMDALGHEVTNVRFRPVVENITSKPNIYNPHPDDEYAFRSEIQNVELEKMKEYSLFVTASTQSSFEKPLSVTADISLSQKAIIVNEIVHYSTVFTGISFILLGLITHPIFLRSFSMSNRI